MIWNAVPRCNPYAASDASASVPASPSTAPSRPAASKIFTVLRRITSNYASSANVASPACISCMTSPSAMPLVASAMIARTRMRFTPTMSWKARE